MFIQSNDKENEPYIFTIIRQLEKNLEKLEVRQILMVYEGIGHMVGCVDNFQYQGELIVNMLALPHQ